FFRNPPSQALVRDLLECGVRPAPPDAPADGPLAGQTFVITGTLSQARGDVEAMIRARGGLPGGSVTRRTDYVVVGDSPGSKLAKAEKLGIPILDEAALMALLG
ncbi:MAG: BRCT domain-containing protein, partial [Candidatus Dormibacteria bacterium]